MISQKDAVIVAARELVRVYSCDDEGQPPAWQIHARLVAWAALIRAFEAIDADCRVDYLGNPLVVQP